MFNLPNTVPISRYRFTFLLKHDLHLPPYAASTLRGVFGHALLENICICGQRETHTKDCPYSHIFSVPPNTQLSVSQQKTPPQPYVLESPFPDKMIYRAGESYSFQMVLFGKVRLLLPLIVSIWRKVFELGIGKQKSQGELTQVAVQNGENWHNILSSSYLLSHNNYITLPTQFPNQIKMVFQTPLRLQHQSKILSANQISADLILRHTMRRVSTIAQLYFDTPLNADYTTLSQLAQNIQGECRLHWQDWQRYSNRQQQAMKLGGLMGECLLHDIPYEFAILLHIGQWLHIGKETVFGLGGYRVQAA